MTDSPACYRRRLIIWVMCLMANAFIIGWYLHAEPRRALLPFIVQIVAWFEFMRVLEDIRKNFRFVVDNPDDLG